MQKAYAQANDTINAANKQAQEILDSATPVSYTHLDVYKRQNQGLISRVQSETDKRKTLLFLTEKAHALKLSLIHI